MAYSFWGQLPRPSLLARFFGRKRADAPAAPVVSPVRPARPITCGRVRFDTPQDARVATLIRAVRDIDDDFRMTEQEAIDVLAELDAVR